MVVLGEALGSYGTLERSLVLLSGSLISAECWYELGRGASSLTLLFRPEATDSKVLKKLFERSVVLLSGPLTSDEYLYELGKGIPTLSLLLWPGLFDSELLG